MAGYRGHLVVGGIAFLLVRYLCPFTMAGLSAVGYCICTMLGALFPDIDTKSKGQKIFYYIFFVCMLGLLYTQHYRLSSYIAVCVCVPLMVSHRGIFHASWFLICLISLSAYLLTRVFPVYAHTITYAALFFLLGVLSHLLVDFGPYSLQYIKRKLSF